MGEPVRDPRTGRTEVEALANVLQQRQWQVEAERNQLRTALAEVLAADPEGEERALHRLDVVDRGYCGGCERCGSVEERAVCGLCGTDWPCEWAQE